MLENSAMHGTHTLRSNSLKTANIEYGAIGVLGRGGEGVENIDGFTGYTGYIQEIYNATFGSARPRKSL